MKPLTDQQLRDHAAASRRGALEGFLGSGGVALAASLYAQRVSPSYRRLPPSLKTLAGIILIAPCISIQAERRGLEYDKTQWEGEALRVMDEKVLVEERRWLGLSLKEKIEDWSSRHQYTIILGGWAASLGIAAAIISRQRYQTYAQKIVQARMWAQGLTVGLLIGAGALTHSNRAKRAIDHEDHSWRDLLEQQERDRILAEKEKAVSVGVPVPTAGREAFSARYSES
ncbi:hypothetical protein BDQ17DRAFT_1465355 [Cyathus striatus]|nr:hypothetical protein BDQ17DRAFT_1465355 [Cyathus striatus]